VASTLSIQDDILNDCIKSDSKFLQSYLSAWSAKFGDVQNTLPNKQPFWDRPGVLEDKALVEASLNSIHLWALFLAASTHHSGDWLFAMPIASCGIRLDDEAVRVAVGLRLGLDLCVPHKCHCGSLVDARGLHSFVYTGRSQVGCRPRGVTRPTGVAHSKMARVCILNWPLSLLTSV